MPRVGRRYFPWVYVAWNVRRFVQNPVRWAWRRALALPAIGLGPLRIGLNRLVLSFLGFTIRISPRGITIQIPIISFLLGLLGGLFGGLFRKKGGRGGGSGGGDSGKRGGGRRSGSEKSGQSGGKKSGSSGGSTSEHSGDSRESRGSEGLSGGGGPREPREPGDSGDPREPRAAGSSSEQREPREPKSLRERLEGARNRLRERHDSRRQKIEKRRDEARARIEREDSEDRERARELESEYQRERNDATERHGGDSTSSAEEAPQQEVAEVERQRREEGERRTREAAEAERQRREEGERRTREAAEAERQRREEDERRTREAAEAERQRREEDERRTREAAEAERQRREEDERRTREAAEAERQKREEDERRAHDSFVAEASERKRRRRAGRHPQKTNQRFIPPPVDEAVAAEGAEFDIEGPLPFGRVLLEASAGTGKTFNLTSLVVRYVVESGFSIDSFLIVTFTRSAAAELREKTREKLDAALRCLMSRKAPNERDNWLKPIVSTESEEETQERIVRIRDAIADLDGAMITTIHGFCQRTLGEIGLRNGGLSLENVGADDGLQVQRSIRDVVIATLAKDVNYLGPEIAEDPLKAVTKLADVVRARNANSAELQPNEPCDSEDALRWVGAAAAVIRQQEVQRRESGATSFDDLVLVLEAVLADPILGHDVRAQLSDRYKVIMIDEFQDTDSKQWSIFNALFEGSSSSGTAQSRSLEERALVMVGDPKQAIYRFRGADINAYLRATASDDSVSRFKLSKNYRSDKRLIDATNGLLSGREFGHDRISYVQVSSPPDAPDGALKGGGTPLQVRWVPSHLELLEGGKSLKVDVVRPHIAEDLANHVVMLLSEGEIPTKTGVRGVRESDVTVLVRAKDDALPIIDALQRRKIPVIQTRLDSVLHTEAAEQIGLLLKVLENYADARSARTLAFSWFINLPYEELLNEQTVAQLQTRCASWAEELSELGVFAFYQKFRLDAEVVSAVSARAVQRGAETLERLLTDLEHVVELLHAATERQQLDARGYSLEFAKLRAEPADSETQERRTESDLNAVNITTIHASKGLEYPIVLLPFPKALNNRTPYVYSIGDARFVDGAPLTEWSTGSSNADSRKEYSRLETDGDEMRLAYVALTRAIYQTVIWWANTKGMGASPMAKILFDQTGKSRESLKVPKDDEVRNRLAALKAKSMNNISIVELPPNIAPKPLSQFGPESLQLPTAARLKRRHLSRREFWRWSYSTVKDSISDHELIHAAGNDEPYQPSLNVSESSGGALQDQPAGAEYGSWFHAVMEQLNFDAPDLPVHIGEVLDGAPFDGASRAAHVTGIAAVIQTPIHSVAADFSLRNLARQNRLDESEFLIGLGIGDQPVQLSRLAEVVASDMSHPFASYFARMAQTVGRKQYQGLLTGSLDGLYRVPSEGGKGFLIVDFKSNKLGDYGYESMKLEMERHDYPLQALLYSVGLHRFLKMKLGGYQPHLHLGGSAYLFVRGMRGADTPIVSGVTEGVFHWRYSPELIEEVSRWCMGGPSQ